MQKPYSQKLLESIQQDRDTCSVCGGSRIADSCLCHGRTMSEYMHDLSDARKSGISFLGPISLEALEAYAAKQQMPNENLPISEDEDERHS